jgi:hypothetical protein
MQISQVELIVLRVDQKTSSFVLLLHIIIIEPQPSTPQPMTPMAASKTAAEDDAAPDAAPDAVPTDNDYPVDPFLFLDSAIFESSEPSPSKARAIATHIWIDAQYYPHILDTIITFAPLSVKVAFLHVSRPCQRLVRQLLSRPNAVVVEYDNDPAATFPAIVAEFNPESGRPGAFVPLTPTLVEFVTVFQGPHLPWRPNIMVVRGAEQATRRCPALLRVGRNLKTIVFTCGAPSREAAGYTLLPRDRDHGIVLVVPGKRDPQLKVAISECIYPFSIYERWIRVPLEHLESSFDGSWPPLEWGGAESWTWNLSNVKTAVLILSVCVSRFDIAAKVPQDMQNSVVHFPDLNSGEFFRASKLIVGFTTTNTRNLPDYLAGFIMLLQGTLVQIRQAVELVLVHCPHGKSDTDRARDSADRLRLENEVLDVPCHLRLDQDAWGDKMERHSVRCVDVDEYAREDPMRAWLMRKHTGTLA